MIPENSVSFPSHLPIEPLFCYLQKTTLDFNVPFTIHGNLDFAGEIIFNCTSEFTILESGVLKAISIAIKAKLFNSLGNCQAIGGSITFEVEELFYQKGGLIQAKEDITGTSSELIVENQAKMFSEEGLILLVTAGTLGLDAIVQAAKEISLESEKGPFWCQNGRILTPKAVEIISPFFNWNDLVVVSDSLKIQGGIGKFTKVTTFTKNHQTYELAVADFLESTLHSENGLIEFSTKTGLYTASTVTSENNSIKYQSLGSLTLNNMTNNAKDQILMKGHTLIDIESSHLAENEITQFADDLLISKNCLLASQTSSVTIDSRMSHTDKLMVIANNFAGKSIDDGLYLNGDFRVTQEVLVASENGVINLNHSKSDSAHFTVEANSHILMEKVRLFIEKQATVGSLNGCIDLSFSNFQGPGSVEIAAPSGLMNFTHATQKNVRRIVVEGLYAAFENSNIETLEDQLIDTMRVKAEDAEFISQTNSIKVQSVKSIQFKNVQKNALNGVIEEESKWIIEHGNQNKALGISRQATSLNVIKSKDVARKVTTKAFENSQFLGYSTVADHLSSELTGLSTITKSDFDVTVIDIKGDDLHADDNNFTFDDLQVQSKSLQMLYNDIVGNSSAFVANEPASFIGNTLDTKSNVIKAQNIHFTENRVQGDQTFTALDGMNISHNSFTEGSIAAETSHGDVTLENNSYHNIDSLQANNKTGAILVKTMEATFPVFVEAAQTIFESSKLDNVTFKTHALEVKDSDIFSEDHLEGKIEKIWVENSTIKVNSINLQNEQAFIKNSEIAGSKSHNFKSKNAHITHSQLKSETEDARLSIEKGTIRDTLILGEKDTTLQGGSLDVKNSNLTSLKGDATVLGDHITLRETTTEGKNVTHIIHDLTSIESKVIAEQSFHRQVNHIFMERGHDSAAEMSENIGRGYIDNHSIHAELLQQNVNKVVFNNNMIHADDAALNGNYSGMNNHFKGGTFEFSGQDIDLPHSKLEVENMSVSATDMAALPNSQMKGIFEIKAPVAHLREAKVNGTLILEEAKKVEADFLETKGEALVIDTEELYGFGLKTNVEKVIDIQASGFVSIPQADFKTSGELNIHAQDLNAPSIISRVLKDVDINVTGSANLDHFDGKVGTQIDIKADFVNLDHSKIEATHISEVGTRGISSAQAVQTADKTIIQETEGILNNEKAILNAAEKITQLAKDAILDTESKLKSDEIKLKSNYINSNKGELDGDFSIKTTTWENKDTALKLRQDLSKVKAKTILSNEKTKTTGKGSIELTIDDEYVEKGQVDIGGSYILVTQGNANFRTAIKSNKFIVSTPLRVHIIPTADVATVELALIKCKQLKNEATITSEQDIGIDQEYYQDPGKVKAGKLLELSSDHKIDLNKPMQMDSSLNVISKEAVNQNAPLDLKGNLYMKGSNIGINERTDVVGRGVFSTPGNLIFNHTTVNLRNGIDVEANHWLIRTSNVEVVGKSALNTIKVNTFTLEGEVKVPFRRYTPKAYKHTPSNFHLVGDLFFDAVHATNYGSNFLVEGNGFLKGVDFTNVNFEHLVMQRVENGKVKKKKFGFKIGSERLYEIFEKRIVDGYANTQFQHTVTLDLQRLMNFGGIFHANKIEGRASLFNGVFSTIGKVTPIDHSKIPYLPGIRAAMPGGSLIGTEEVNVTGPIMHNNGFVDGEKVTTKATVKSINEPRVVTSRANCIRKKKWNKVKLREVEVDHAEGGGKINGKLLDLDSGPYGKNSGNIAGRDDVKMKGHDFDQEAVKIRSVKDRYFHESYIPATTLSGNTMDQTFTGRFTNSGSDIISWGDGKLVAGEFVQKTLFAVNTVQNESALGKKRKIKSVEMQESRIMSIKGDRTVKTMRGDAYVEGKIGSLMGKLTTDSAGDFHLGAKTASATNHIRNVNRSFNGVEVQSVKATTTKTSLPHFFAGNGADVKANVYTEEGAQVDIVGDATYTIKNSHVKGHAVISEVKTKTTGLKMKFFGSDAVEKVLNREKSKEVAQSVLREDPAIAAVLNLAASRDRADAIKNGVMAGAHIWNEADAFSKAFSDGKLVAAIGQHLGITDGKGNFSPRLTFSLGFSKNSFSSTTFIPSQHIHRGNLRVDGDDQLYEGAKYKVTKSAYLNGKRITKKSEVNTTHQKGSGITPSVTVGEKVDVGVDFQKSESNSKTHSNTVFDVDDTFEVDAKEHYTLDGAYVEADIIKGTTPNFNVSSELDTKSQKHVQFGASTAPSVHVAYGEQSTAEVTQVTGMKARVKGTFDAKNMNKKGSKLENIEVTADSINKEDIVETKESFGFNFSGTLPKESFDINGTLPENNSQPVNISGFAGYKREKEKTILHSVIGSGEQREKIKSKKLHVEVPLVYLQGQPEIVQAPQAPVAPGKEENPAEVKAKEKPIAKPQTKPVEQAKPKEKPKPKEKEKAASFSPKLKEKAEEGKRTLFLNPEPVVEQEPIKKEPSRRERIENAIIFALTANERDAAMEDMVDVGLKEAPGKIIEDLSKKHPKFKKVVEAVSYLFTPITVINEFVFNQLMNQMPENAEEIYKRNVEIEANRKFERLNIPKEATEQYHADIHQVAKERLGITLMTPIITPVIAKATSKIANAFKRPNLINHNFPEVPKAANNNHFFESSFSLDDSNVIYFPKKTVYSHLTHGLPKYIREAAEILKTRSIDQFDRADPRPKILMAVADHATDPEGALSFAKYSGNQATLKKLYNHYDLKLKNVQEIDQLYHEILKQPDIPISGIWFSAHGYPRIINFLKPWDGRFLNPEAALCLDKKIGAYFETCSAGKYEVGGVMGNFKESLDLFKQRAFINGPREVTYASSPVIDLSMKDGLPRVRFSKTQYDGLSRTLVTEAELDFLRRELFENFQKSPDKMPKLSPDLSLSQFEHLQQYWKNLARNNKTIPQVIPEKVIKTNKPASNPFEPPKSLEIPEKLPKERKTIIKMIEKIGYREVKDGGKGSHGKWVRENSPTFIINEGNEHGEISSGVLSDLNKNYKKALEIDRVILEKAANIQTKQVNPFAYEKPFPRRTDYSRNYLNSAKEFIDLKEFTGVLENDLHVVQYNGKSHKWFMSAIEANELNSFEKLQNAIPKLSTIGEIEQVTVARIPAGETVRYLQGKAKPQMDPVTKETRAGGGTEYRFFDFDPSWIVQTRDLPK